MSRTRELTDWSMKAVYHDFAQETVEQAKGLFLKTIAGMLIGSREPVSKVLTTYFAETAGPPEAGVVAGGFRTSVENAAFANGTFAHASELEDNEVPSITSDYWIFPAIFPLAEKYVSTGREIIESAVVSWEVASRFCRAAPGSEMIKLHCMPPSWFCGLGIAAAGARLAKLTIDQAEHAVEIAGVFSGGLGGGMSDAHFLGTGHTCMIGVQAVRLAKAGARGYPGGLELAGSLFAPVWSEGNVNPDLINADLGKPPYLINEACIKKFSACTFTHTSIDALGILMREHNVKYEDVERVETRISDVAYSVVGTKPSPPDLLTARFSVHYLLGEVLLRGKVDLHTFEGEEKLSDPRHKEAESKIKASILPGLPASSPVCELTLVKKNGEKLFKRLEGWIGSPKHPLTLEQVRDVCRPYLEAMLDKSQCDRVEELVLNLEKQPDILELMDILTFSRVGRRM